MIDKFKTKMNLKQPRKSPTHQLDFTIDGQDGVQCVKTLQKQVTKLKKQSNCNSFQEAARTI